MHFHLLYTKHGALEHKSVQQRGGTLIYFPGWVTLRFLRRCVDEKRSQLHCNLPHQVPLPLYLSK